MSKPEQQTSQLEKITFLAGNSFSRLNINISLIKACAFLFLVFMSGIVMGSEVVLGNSHTSIKFEPENGYALVELLNKDTGRSVNLRGKGEGLNPGLWKMNVINGSKEMIAPAGGVKHVIESGENGKTLIITWNNVDVAAKDRQGKMTVVAKFFLPENDSIAKCSLDFKIDGTPAPWIRSVSFPYLTGIQTLGDDYFINCASIGRIVRDPTRRMLEKPPRCGKLCYPGWSMQFVAFYGSNLLNANNLVDISQSTSSNKGRMTDEFTGAVIKDGKYDKVNGFYRGTALDETGMYVACEDGDFYYKECISGRLASQKDSFNIEFVSNMGLPFWPQNSKKNADTFIYKMPYQFAIGVYSGGMPQACDRYRQWAVNQKWMRRGKINSTSPDNDVSTITKNSTIWGYGGESPAYYVPNVLAINDYYKVPMANHWAAWYAVPFDFDNPEYWPTEPQLAQALKEMSGIGINTTGYICTLLWDYKAASWNKYNGFKHVALKENGEPQEYFKNRTARMDPASELWQKNTVNMSDRMIEQLGFGGVYYDVFGCTTMISFNGDLHSPNGGNYWITGGRKLLDESKANARKINPESFMSCEGFGEPYIDYMDAYLTLDLNRSGWRFKDGFDCFPLFSYVYHDYVITYGAEFRRSAFSPGYIRFIAGLGFSWGIQLTENMHYPYSRPESKEDKKIDLFLKEIVHGWHRAGKKFITGGLGVETANIPDRKLAGTAPVAVISPMHSLKLGGMSSGTKWTGPSVTGSTWKAVDETIGITVVNISDKNQKAELIIDSGKLRKAGETLWRSWPLPVARMATLDKDTFSLPLEFKTAGAMIFEIRDNTPPVINALEEKQWELVEVSKNLKFEPVNLTTSNLLGSADTLTQNTLSNKKNDIQVLDKDKKARMHKTEITFSVPVQKSPKGFPCGPDDKRFYVLNVTPYKVTGDAVAQIYWAEGVLYGTITAKTKITFEGAPGCQILIRNAAEKLTLVQGKVSLDEGAYEIAAWSQQANDPQLSKDDLYSQLAANSTKLVTDATNILSKSMVSDKDKSLAQHYLALGNAFALVGAKLEVALNSNITWVVPFVPLSISFKGSLNSMHSKLLVLSDEYKKMFDIKSAADKSFDLTCHNVNVSGNLVPVLYYAEAEVNGYRFAATCMVSLNVDIPLIIDQTGNKDGISGEDLQDGSIVVANISPYTLPLHMFFTESTGKNKMLEKMNSNVTIKPFEDLKIPLELKVPGKNNIRHKRDGGVCRFNVNYTRMDDTNIYIPVEVNIKSTKKIKAKKK